MLIDTDKYHKRVAKHLLKYLNIDAGYRANEKFKKFAWWWLYSMPKTVANILQFILLVWIFNKLYHKYGFEKLIIIMAVSIIFSLSRLNQFMKKLVAED